MMLVDRDREISAFDALLHECAQGKGVMTVIRGPVGSGKTALLRAFADRAGVAPAIFLGAVASRAEQGLPLGILGQLFRSRPLPASVATQAAELIENREPTAGRCPLLRLETVSPSLARVSEGLLKLLGDLAENGPVVLAVDDLQHADVASLQCLSYLARRTSAMPVLTVLTEGTHTLPADRSLHAEILRQGNCHDIALGLLPPSSVARLLTEYLDAEAARHLAPDCHDMTAGSPLLVRAMGEDSRAAGGRAPSSLLPGPAFRSAVVTCLHRYDPKTVELGQALALLGQAASHALLGELLAVTPELAAEGIGALGSSGLLESGHFRHEQARQAVLAHMTAVERATMHGDVARALYRAGAGPAALARHLMSAHRIGAQWAVAALQEAADQALADGEAESAIGYLRRAESQCADDRQRAVLVYSLVCAEWHIDPERVARYLPEVVAYARAGLLDGERLSELTHYLLWMGHTSDAAEVMGVLDAGSPDSISGSAELAIRHGTIPSPVEFLYPDVISQARRAVSDAKGSGRPAVPARRHRPGPLPSLGTGGSEAVAAAAERILSERKLNDPTLASVTTALMALICEDMLDRAASLCDMLLRESEASRGSPLLHAVLTAFLAMIETRWGNLLAAEDYARKALTLLTRKAWGVAIGAPLSSLLLSTTASRKHSEAAACLRIPVPEAMFGTFHGLLYVYARGEYHLATGHPKAALADFSDCGRRMMMWGLDLPGLLPWRIKAAEAHLAIGDSLEARELSEEQLAQAGARFARTRGISLRVLALTSHPTKRAAMLRESVESLQSSGARLELAYTFAELSNAHLALGELGRARWAARQARDLAERCGAQLPTAALSGVDIGPTEAGNGTGTKLLGQLSEAEQRVAALAACGYTNGQIAHKLYITVSTVEQHLTRVYRKLGVTSRAELPIDILPPPKGESRHVYTRRSTPLSPD
jgi:DNA-binding NarL/FixJ family response regulator